MADKVIMQNGRVFFLFLAGLEKAVAWQWLLQAVTAAKALVADSAKDADFYQGKIHTCRYFFACELSKLRGLAIRLRASGDGLTAAMKPGYVE